VLAAALLIRVGVEWQVFAAPDFVNRTHVTVAVSGSGWEWAALILSIVYSLNFLLFIFNLIPLPPFDGSSAVMLLMNDRLAAKYQDFLSNGTLQIFGLFVAWKAIGEIFPALFFPSLNLLYPGMDYR
jgi:Zn-dependent protease